jgi:dihydroceramidase
MLGFAVAGVALFITLYYHHVQDPKFHQDAYAILTVVVFGRSLYVMERDIRPYFRGRHAEHVRLQADRSVSEAVKAEEKRKDVRDGWILKQMWMMVGFGLGICVGGFGVWTLDNEYCSTFRAWRHAVGLPWGILLEGHGWWHLMTGLGAYYSIGERVPGLRVEEGRIADMLCG